jgi:ankyrin repeat protein
MRHRAILSSLLAAILGCSISGAEAQVPPETRQMLAAAHDGDVVQFRKLVKAGVNFNAQDEAGNSALTLAVQSNREEMVRALLDYHVALNRRGALGMTALGVATLQGARQMVERLLRAGADVDAADASGVTPLSSACRLGRWDLARRLLSAGAAPDKADQTGKTPLLALAGRRVSADDGEAAKIAAELLARGADPNARDSEARTPLGLALAKGHASLAATLVDNPRTDLRKLSEGYTPLAWARQLGQEDLAQRIELRLQRR